ncbi:chondroitinase-B domain-containing protein [Aquimarina sp. W85]|uniref:chondroitinase-B domain-containing protein n=1 Tax=Aquimarina rhodophyticola TaxID=3342246 RepID=UPI00366D8A7F
MKFIPLVFILLLTVISCQDDTLHNTVIVTSSNELNEAIKTVKAGDVLILKNGVWKDTHIAFYGNGTEANPIILRAETAGKVILEGNSSLYLGGSYLQVSGLHFKNGYTDKKAVVRFKINDQMIAHHSQVTNCVIQDFTKPDRASKDHWIELWGQNNTLAHNYLAGKTNKGPTIRVFLAGNENINTNHQITNNLFGPRPRKGGPQAETIQIGDSYTSMTPGYVNVAYNFFDRCNGEVEIISSKSNYNTFKNNIFYESEGSLVLRHGNYATINGNIFIGHKNSSFVGGIRIINTGHWIYNNYFYNLKGEGFRAPLAVMNGIPKSPLNRYNQVTDVVVANNSFINCVTPWHFGVGANLNQRDVLPPSEIRSARAKRMIVANNLLFTENSFAQAIKIYDSITGVTFQKNISNIPLHDRYTTRGIITKNMEIKSFDHFFYVPQSTDFKSYKGFNFERIDKDLFENSRTNTSMIGAITQKAPKASEILDKRNYGPSWFNPVPTKQKQKTILVSSTKELTAAINQSNSGDIIALNAGEYEIDETLTFAKALLIKAADSTVRPVLNFKEIQRGFELQPRAKVQLKNIILKGTKSTDAFATLDNNMSQAYELWLDHVEVDGFKSILEASKSSFADTIFIKNSILKNTLRGIELNKEIDDKGDYNAAFVFITDSTFDNLSESVLDYYRGGYDESTIGGSLVVRNNVFSNSGKNEASKILLKSRGIVNVTLADNTFKNNSVTYIAILWGEKGQQPINNTVDNSGKIEVVQNLELKLVY